MNYRSCFLCLLTIFSFAQITVAEVEFDDDLASEAERRQSRPLSRAKREEMERAEADKAEADSDPIPLPTRLAPLPVPSDETTENVPVTGNVWEADPEQERRQAARLEQPLPAGHAYIFLVMDVTAENIGKGVRRDLVQLKQTFLDAFDDGPLKGRGTVIVLPAEDGLTPGYVTQQLGRYQNRLGANDTALLFYSGHGIYHTQRRHTLQLSGGDLLRSEVLSSLKETGAGNVVLLSSACSNIVKGSSGYGSGNFSPTGGRNFVLEDLLFRSRGVTDITAATEGESAWTRSDIGGAFPIAFTTTIGQDWITLDTNNDNYVSWYEFFNATKVKQDETLERFKAEEVEGRRKLTPETTQTLRRFSLGRAKPLSEIPDRVIDNPIERINPNAPAEIYSLKTRSGEWQGRRGFFFDISCVVRFHQGDNMFLSVQFFDLNGARLVDRNGAFRTTEGTVAVARRLKPGFPTTSYNLTLFMPFSEFDLSRGVTHHFTYNAYITDSEKQTLVQSKRLKGWFWVE